MSIFGSGGGDKQKVTQKQEIDPRVAALIFDMINPYLFSHLMQFNNPPMRFIDYIRRGGRVPTIPVTASPNALKHFPWLSPYVSQIGGQGLSPQTTAWIKQYGGGAGIPGL